MKLRTPACEYADRGLKIFPLVPGISSPFAGTQGYKDATSNVDVIHELWTLEPNANIGIACGPSGLLVVDVDPRNGGEETLAELQGQCQLPPAPTSGTPGGGRHFYFQLPDRALRGGVPGIDLKVNGFAVALPSVRRIEEIGRYLDYWWLPDRGIDDLDVPPFPIGTETVCPTYPTTVSLGVLIPTTHVVK